MSSDVCLGEEKCFATGRSAFFFHRSEMLASIAEPTSNFADVTQGACTTSNDVDEVTSGACERLSNCQRSTRGVDLGR